MVTRRKGTVKDQSVFFKPLLRAIVPHPPIMQWDK